MPRRDRQRTELLALCRSGAVVRAVDLAFTHFAEFGRDHAIIEALAGAVERTQASDAVRRRLADLHTALERPDHPHDQSTR